MIALATAPCRTAASFPHRAYARAFEALLAAESEKQARRIIKGKR